MKRYWPTVIVPAMNEDSMPSKRMVPEQEVAELSDEIVRLRAELIETRQWRDAETEVRLKRDAEIAVLTEQRDRAMKALQYYTVVPGSWKKLALETLAALDAEAAAETEGQ